MRPTAVTFQDVSQPDPAAVASASRRLPRRDDRWSVLFVVVGFSFALGVGTVTTPLLALASGYDPATVGFLAATAALTQLLTRFGLPWLLGRYRDRSLIAVSSLMMAAAFGLLLLSTALAVFVAAQVLHGAARALFWTSSQTHAIRGPGDRIRRLVDLNVAGGAGTLAGPAIAGTLAVFGLSASLAAALIAALIAAAATLRLHGLAPFDRRGSAGTLGLLRRDGVDIACWASAAGGVWWSMMGSFIPVVLVGAGLGPAGVGWLITASESAGVVALLALRGLPAARVRTVVVVAAVAAPLALALVALAPPVIAAYAGLMLLGGAASGTVTTLAPAMASLAAGPQEQGDAMALTGTLRAAALFGAPALVGVLLSAVLLTPALVGIAVLAVVPGAVVGRPRRAAPPQPAA